MHFGTIVYFDLGRQRRADEVFRHVYKLILSQHGFAPSLERKTLITQNFAAQDEREFTSIEAWVPYLPECRSAYLTVMSANDKRAYTVYGNSVKDGCIGVLKVELSSSLWMRSLEALLGGSYERVVADSVGDYALCKHLFRELDAERCLGSSQDNYLDIDEPGADEAFRFTRNGPQMLVRPLEEERTVRTDELRTDPATGLEWWAWIVDKPFSEIGA